MRHMKKIFIVEDEPDISDLISLHLTKSGFDSVKCSDYQSLKSGLRGKNPDLIILDLMLPDKDGLEICKELRSDKKTAQIPIIILTAKSEEIDKILGLELGAEDYMTKPFSPKELVARVKTVLRRSTLVDNQNKVTIKIGNCVEINKEKYEIYINSKKIDTTTTEFKILELLASRPGVVFSREKILEHLWGYEKDVFDRTVDVHIRHLREKLGDQKEIIKNVRGVGYKCIN